jgi:hypothetical protein
MFQKPTVKACPTLPVPAVVFAGEGNGQGLVWAAIRLKAETIVIVAQRAQNQDFFVIAASRCSTPIVGWLLKRAAKNGRDDDNRLFAVTVDPRGSRCILASTQNYRALRASASV